MITVFEHLEAFAGEILHGWSVDADGKKLPFQVVQTAGGPHAGTTTFATLGLSNFPLPDHKFCTDPQWIRHELLMVVPADSVPPNIAGIVQQVGLAAMERGAAYLRGELIGPRGALFSGFEPKALYVAAPVYFPDEFAGVTADGVGDVIFAWLVPLLDEEVSYLSAHGWSAFEDRFVSEDPDLVDYARKAPQRQEPGAKHEPASQPTNPESYP